MLAKQRRNRAATPLLRWTDDSKESVCPKFGSEREGHRCCVEVIDEPRRIGGEIFVRRQRFRQFSGRTSKTRVASDSRGSTVVHGRGDENDLKLGGGGDRTRCDRYDGRRIVVGPRSKKGIRSGMEKKKNIARAIRKSFGGTSKRRRVRWLYGFATLISVTVFVLFWCTNVFRDAILSNLVLRNGSPAFLLWQQPPAGLTVKVYVFNYTNWHEFENGNASKLRVEEVGPYVYRETLHRVNVEVHANQTVTYQEKRSFQWVAGESGNDKVIVPNLLLMSTLAYSRNLRYFTRIGLTILLAGLQTKPFIELPVDDYLWGYEDKLFKVIKPFVALKHPIPDNDKIGVLVLKQGLNADRITMHTGVDDLRNLGLIERINGQEYRRIWGDDRCDRVYGTDGSMFPPPWIEKPNSTLYVYAKDVCRSLPFRYEKRGFSNGIPTLRYKLPSDAFTSPPNKDSCFCPKESYDSIDRRCPPAGTFNVSACKYGTPVLVSFPHFYSGDESLFEQIDGLKPQPERHESYIEIHPRLGVTVGIGMRLQLNMEVRKTVGVPFSGKLQDGSILPLVWIDSRIDKLPESIREIFYRGHYLVNAIEAGFQWCSLISGILSFGALLASLKGADEDKEKFANGKSCSMDRNVSPRIELDRY